MFQWMLCRCLKAIAKEYFSLRGSMRERRIKLHPFGFDSACSNHRETSNYFTNVREHWWNENNKLINGEKSVRFKCKLYQETERWCCNPCAKIKITQSQSMNMNSVYSENQLCIVCRIISNTGEGRENYGGL